MKTAFTKDVLNCTPALDEKLVQPERSLFLFGLWLHQGKNRSIFISIKSHNVEVKLCSLKRLMVLQVANNFAHRSCSIIL